MIKNKRYMERKAARNSIKTLLENKPVPFSPSKLVFSVYMCGTRVP